METLNFLFSEAGEEAIRLAGSIPDVVARLDALRKRYAPEEARAAAEQAELRRRAAKKFTRADEMFFTREALEQASSEEVARYRAERFSGEVTEIGCGIGGDTIGLAARCAVTAFDRDPVRLSMAKRNLLAYGLSARFVCADLSESPEGLVFVDPSRRENGRRSVHLSEISPSLDFIRGIRGAVKLSPATPYSELAELPGELEFISLSGECKEALVWTEGEGRRATLLPERASIWHRGVRAPVAGVRAYLYDPDPAVVRAHAVAELAEEIGASLLDPQIAYLTADDAKGTPFARCYRVIDSLPFNRKKLSQRLSALGAGRVVVKKRGVPFEPSLSLHGDRELTLVLARVGERPLAVICDIMEP
ncbi:MAG: class I SAM-dependent methyltransferase [Armatimonadota bacterium]